jgi:hypothetical protein
MFFDGSKEVPNIKEAKIVSIFNVLEHTMDPLSFLPSISKSMASSFYLVVEVPLLDSISRVVQMANPELAYRHIYPP